MLCSTLLCTSGENSVTSFRDTRQAYMDLSEQDKEFYKQIDCTFKFENGTFYDLDEDDKELKCSKVVQEILSMVLPNLGYIHILRWG